ncbi:MAG: SIR2 family protein [Deltaproteobacteria bacterium]|nr:SIR2 family protein [Deltaproteobacteria bacterium]
MSNSGPQKVVFLFGSGISYKAGMPKLHEITERVLCGEGIYYDSGLEIFTPYKRPIAVVKIQQEEENVRRVVKYLHWLKVEIDNYYEIRKFKQDTNYEDLYHMVSQIYYSQVGEYENPAIQPLIDKMLHEIEFLLSKTNNRPEWTLTEFARATKAYLEDMVFHSLNKQPMSLEYLDCIKRACKDEDFPKVDIFTLNHDTVLEKYLKHNGIHFTDGFSEPEGEQNKYWEPSVFSNGAFKICLVKLHGSINWFRFRLKDATDWSGETIIIPSGMKDSVIAVITDSQGQIWEAMDLHPKLLIGTYNTMLDYLSGIYTELHYQFYRSLGNVKQLVICGYGLGDRGINTQIVNWLYSSGNRRIILIDPAPEALKNKINSISNKWDMLLSTNKLTIIPKGIENVCWQELKDNLF